MKFATVTLNPAIDLTAMVNHFTPNVVNRGDAMQIDAGGKGVNVASFLADYGREVAVTGFLGRENAEIFERLFTQKQIADRFVRVPGENRISVKIVDPANQTTTDLNMPGLSVSEADADSLLQTLEQMASSGEYTWFTLSGRMPLGVGDDFYAVLIERLKKAGARTALDTSQAALRLGAAAGPTLLKPNIDELRQLVGHELGGDEAVIQAAQDLLENGIQYVAVSMGPRGALLVVRDSAWRVLPLVVPVKSTVGAGDAMVAGLVAGLDQGLSLPECARLATAFSLSAVSRIGAHLPPRAELERIAQSVIVQQVG